MKRVLIIDNYDSFTHNLYQLIGGLGAEVVVHRNDRITLGEIETYDPTHLVLSPGPGHPSVPRDVGLCPAIIDHFGPRVPLLGVCLGHQTIAHHLGGRVMRAPQIVHGKMDTITHDHGGIFAGLESPLEVMRYHSLTVEESGLPAALEVTARTQDGIVMALRHTIWPMVGVQFHPESIGTPRGAALLKNFLSRETQTRAAA